MSTEELLARDPLLANRPYQIEALQSIFQYEKCVVKMFCGTGKSRIMTNVILHENKDLSVVVFPSLALIQQYSSDYLQTFTHQILNISTEMLESIVSTTDTDQIRTFLRRTEPKVILVTYQSFEVLLSCLDQKIPLIQYDEAHHTTGLECQKLVFETDHFEKQVFYTATPETKNGVLYDPDDEESIPLAFEYTYLEGLRDGVLNAFDVCVDMYTENTTQSVYESIARAILTRGTSRGLLFHSGVNGEGNTSVWNFVNPESFQMAFDNVAKEFTNHYTKITFVGMDGNTPTSERKQMLRELDETPMHEIYLISSCETIGEGVDTKRANLCAFVDPKTSTVKLIQNIGRVLRRNPEQPLSTILIPCWINLEHYAGAETREEKDTLIREQMRATNGDYSPVLNVLGALKQDDEELYNMCLHYPNRKHKEASLREQGFEIGEEEYSHEEVDEMRQTSNLEVHTDEEIRTHESVQESEGTTRLYFDEEEDVYRPIEGDEDTVIEPPKPKVRMSIHQNDEIQMLWSVKEVDFTKQFCTVVIECEVSRNEENWHLRRDELCAYIDANGRVPLLNENKCIRTWVDNQKKNYKERKHRMSIPEFRTIWEETIRKYPCLNIDNDNIWHLKHAELCAYIDANGKSPVPKGTPLNQWVSDQKKYYKKQHGRMSTTEFRSIWEETLEKYPCLRDLTQQWYMKHNELCVYVDTYERVPPRKSSLNGWMRTQNDCYDNKSCIMTDEDIRKIWEETIQKYPCLTVDNEQVWHMKHAELCEYIDGNGRVPLLKENKCIHAWVDNQKTNYKKRERSMANEDIRAIWEETIRKYHCLTIDLKDLWHTKHRELCTHIELTRKLPSKGSSLNSWLGNQKQNYKKQENSMANGDTRAIWEETLRKYPILSDRDEQWKIKLAELHIFIDTNKRCPRAKKDSEKILGKWTSHQKTDYNNQVHIMGNPEIRKIWEDTVQKYPCLSGKTTKSMNLSITNAVTESPEQKRQRVHSELSQLHQKYKTLTSDHLREAFTENPSLWHTYHAISEENETSFPEQEIPRNRVIQELAKIKSKRTKLVVDMGCGKAHIARHFQDTRFKFINLDHVACDVTVTACDISNTKLEEDSVEICILSLAMWGSNCKDYLREAHRILESNGILYLIEPTKRWTETEPADKLSALLEESGFRIVEKTIAKFALFICSKY